MRYSALLLGMLHCSACAATPTAENVDLFSDEFAEMRPMLECVDAAKGDRSLKAEQMFESCLGVTDAMTAYRSPDYDNPETLRFLGWLVWDSNNGMRALGHERLRYSVWDEAVDFAKCIEGKAIADQGFFSGNLKLVNGSLSAAHEACGSHPMSLQDSVGNPVDFKDPKTRSKMMANSLAQLSVVAALTHADACPSSEPACLPLPQSQTASANRRPMAAPPPARRVPSEKTTESRVGSND